MVVKTTELRCPLCEYIVRYAKPGIAKVSIIFSTTQHRTISDLDQAVALAAGATILAFNLTVS